MVAAHPLFQDRGDARLERLNPCIAALEGMDVASQTMALVARETIDALDGETLLSPPHARLRFARRAHDYHHAEAVGGGRDDLRAPHHFRWRVAIGCKLPKAVAISSADVEETSSLVPEH